MAEERHRWYDAMECPHCQKCVAVKSLHGSAEERGRYHLDCGCTLEVVSPVVETKPKPDILFQHKLPGDPIRAEDWNAIIDVLRCKLRVNPPTEPEPQTLPCPACSGQVRRWVRCDTTYQAHQRPWARYTLTCGHEVEVRIVT